MTPQRIADLVATFYGLTTAEIRGISRQRTLVIARQMIYALAAANTVHSQQEIATMFCRDHSTITHALGRHRKALSEPAYARDFAALEIVVASAIARSQA